LHHRQSQQFARGLYDPGTPASERLMALRFLLNFTGDLHQPLAAIEHHDQGGDCIAVLPPGAKTPVRLSIIGMMFWSPRPRARTRLRRPIRSSPV
jgi:S1/P1 Nuclease